MKKILSLALILIVSICLFVGIFWQEQERILSGIDEKIAILVELFQDEYSKRDTFRDLDSEQYFNEKTFLLKEYAKDLGYFVVEFPKKPGTILILRRGTKKIVINKDEEIIFSIYGDKFKDGIVYKPSRDENGYFIDYGDIASSYKVSKEAIMETISALIHLRESNSLEDMASENRKDSEKYLSDPEILKSSS